MLAAANGDLSMVKLLIANKAKVEKPDKYKRTALTHAVINGAANVASYLLSLGADPKKRDTSDNTNLHYACAYGWWFCMKVLIEAGAQLDAQNSWRITPLGVAVMKGHKGIVNHMVQLEGIDINMRDDDGRTILMNMINGQENFTSTLREEVKTLIERHGANSLLKDNSNKNMLHYLAEAIPKHKDSSDGSHPFSNYSLKDNGSPILHSEHIILLAKYFIDKGCSVFEIDINEKIPLIYALENDYEVQNSTRSFALVNLFLDEMMKKMLKMMIEKSIAGSNVFKMLQHLLQTFVRKIKLRDIEEYSFIFRKLRPLYKEMMRLNIWEALDVFDKVDEKSNDVTLFGKLCSQYTKCYHPKNKDTTEQVDKYWFIFCSILDMILQDFNPKLNASSSDGKNFHALLTFSTFSSDSCQAFKLILSKTDEIDVEDKTGNTPLLNMIRSKNIEQVKSLVEKGADVNKLRTFEISKGKENREFPIDVALEAADTGILNFLIQQEANTNTFHLTGSSLLHKAVNKCAKKKDRHNLQLVKAIIESNKELVKLKAEYGLTPLHVAVNSGRDDADLSLDLEALLIRSGADVNSLDDFQRTPLHYAFTSLENRDESSPSDPIQIVSILIETMDRQAIHQRDIYGCSSLHYAARRGATVCALLLLKKGI